MRSIQRHLRRPRAVPRPGFTNTELIVVVAVALIIVAIVLTGLGKLWNMLQSWR